MTARHVKGFTHFSPPGDGAIFSTFWGDFLSTLHIKPGEKGEKQLERTQKIQWRRRPEIADFSVPSESASTRVWRVRGLGAGFEIAIEPFRTAERRNPGKGHFYFLCQTLVCTKPWFKRDLIPCSGRMCPDLFCYLLTAFPSLSLPKGSLNWPAVSIYIYIASVCVLSFWEDRDKGEFTKPGWSWFGTPRSAHLSLSVAHPLDDWTHPS